MVQEQKYLNTLSREFFQKNYVKDKMSFPGLSKMLKEEGISISVATIYKYAKKLGFGRTISEARRNWDENCLDYDKVFLSEPIIEAIDGFLLGDGCIPVRQRTSTLVSRLTCNVEHEEFCTYMMSFFKVYNPVIKQYKSSKMKQGFIYSGRSGNHPDLHKQYLRWYQLGSKQPPNDIRITPTSVMLWYLGDGSLVQVGHSISLRLSTDSFSKENVCFLAGKLQEKGIKCHRNNDNRIYIEAKGIPGFFNFIGKNSPVECYSYKFDLPYWRFEAKRMKQVSDELKIDYNNLSYLVKIGRIGCLRTSKNGRPRFLPEHIEEIKKYFEEGNITKEERTRQTNLDRYGVENVFQSEEVKEKLKQINLKRYGVTSPIQNEQIKEKIRQTNRNRYGVDNPMQDKNIREKSQKSFASHVRNNTDRYKIMNILRGSDFWDRLSKKASLIDVCNNMDLKYQSVASILSRPEFKEKYYSTYSFPSQQKQKELFDWLQSIGANVKMNCRDVISPLELDIYDKDKKVAIEFNGSYWHSEANLERQLAKNKHISKTRQCREMGIRLVHVFEHTYIEKTKQFQNFIRSVFGLNTNRVAARKCTITHNNASSFLEAYHIQGKPRDVLRYFNLEYNGEIVGCMTASKHHEKTNNDKGVCVLSRLAFKDNTTVQGGTSKLFKRFLQWSKDNNFDSIVSWSDNCISEGGVYRVLDFELEQEYKPSYFYYDMINKKYRTKQSQRKTNKLRPVGMSILDWNNSRNLFALWDCGKKKWVYSIIRKKPCSDEKILDCIKKIQDNLSFDLIENKYRGLTPIHGACYVASETLYYLLKDEYSFIIMHYKIDDISHWWLETDKEIIDPTAGQFDFDYPYHLGKKGGFLTSNPSKRCRILIDKIT